MKKIIDTQKRYFLSLMIVLSLVFSLSAPISASANTLVQSDEWQTDYGYEYPVTPSDGVWANLSYYEQLEACNMPRDILSDCSTEELADLLLEYPFLVDVLAFNNSSLAIAHLIDTSNIFEEFFSRNGATDVLIDKYEKIAVNYSELVDISNPSAARDSGYISELFLQTYFAHVSDSLTDTQVDKLTNTLSEKYTAKKGICDNFSTALLMFDWIQRENGSIPQYLLPENIEIELSLKGSIVPVSDEAVETSQTRATSGFTSSGCRVGTSAGVTYTVGTYSLYGTTVNCYKYYSGDFTTTEATSINNSFDSAHPSWTRVSTCTNKYNCHSYAWISSSSNNVYWLNNPDNFAESNSFDFVGHGFNTTAASGDKIIICSAVAIEDGFGDYTYSVHSANVTSSSGATRSKLGSYGVYIIPIDELVHFYSGFYYNIYR